jgi:hypothetical protein
MSVTAKVGMKAAMAIVFCALNVQLTGCFLNFEEEPKVVGYAVGGCVGACGKATPFNGWTAWEIGRDSLGLEKYFIYGKGDEMDKLGQRTRSAIQGSDRRALLDVGGQCLTFHQTGKDTVTIDKKQVIVEVPIEPCFPFHYENEVN